MPFIVQCPHADCRKFMLLEDEVRGTTVDCLICTKQVRVDAAGSGGRNPGNQPGAAAAPPQPAPRPAPSPQPPPVQDDQKVTITCPNPTCKTPLRVGPSSKGTNLRCPKCKQVFRA